MMLARLVSGSLPVILVLCGANTVSGQDFPNKPIRIVTTAAGGGADAMARLIATGMSGSIGKQVIVENRAGSAAIPVQTVAAAAADGYTVLFSGAGLWTAPLLEKMPYDPVTDLSPVALLARAPNILVVHPSLPVKTVKELIALAKSKPGQLNVSTGITGSSFHLAAELFKYMAGINIVRILLTPNEY